MAEISKSTSVSTVVAATVLHRIVSRFEESWRRGELPSIDDFLPADPRERRVVLAELIKSDLEYRVKSALPVQVEDYFQRYPELAANAHEALELIVAEFAVRRRAEPELSIEAYVATVRPIAGSQRPGTHRRRRCGCRLAHRPASRPQSCSRAFFAVDG